MKYHDALARLQNVTVHPGYATACCPAHGDNSPSLSVRRLDNDEAYFTCFAGCDWRVVTAAVEGHPYIPREESLESSYTSDRNSDSQEYALELWDNADSDLEYSPVDVYLYHRALDLPATHDIRYLPSARHPSGGSWPAMIAAITNVDHEIIGVHRTFITSDGDKAPVTPAKMMLGHCLGGAVRFLSRYAEEIPPTLFIAEGIETALSVKALFGDIKVYAGLSVYGMRSVAIEPGVRNVVIVADGDEPGSIAFKAAQRAVAAFQDRGYNAYLLRCSQPGKDFNDILVERQGRK